MKKLLAAGVIATAILSSQTTLAGTTEVTEQRIPVYEKFVC